jgi:TonB family protein
MRVLLASALFITLSAALASPAGAQAQGAAALPPQVASGPDISALVSRIDAVRLHYTSSRLSAARDQLSGTLDLVRSARETEAARATTPAAGQLPRAGRDVPMPGLLKRLEPEYPIEAAKRGVTGYVVLDAVIDKSGKVRDPRVARSIPEFDQAALNAARAWRFAAPRVNGTSAEVSALLVFAFVIRNEASPPDELNLARFYVERANYAPAEAALGRALETIARETDCRAAILNAAAEQRAAAAQRNAGGSPIKPPLKIKDVKPAYPALAQRARVSGVVVVEGVIGEDGRIQCARVMKSVPLLDQAALDAVSQWEFVPFSPNGTPIPMRLTMSVNFTLQ